MVCEQTTPDYFDRAYRDYLAQNPRDKLDHYLATIERFHTTTDATVLLDIGCGRGAFLRHVNQMRPGWSLFGSDVEESGLATTRGLVPGAHLVLSSAEDPVFEEGTFDVITAWDVVEHVPDTGRVRSAVQRMLKPSGLFVFVVPVYDGVSGPVIRRLDRDPTHLHKLGRQDWLDWATPPFEVVHWHGVFRYLMTPRHYLHLPTQRLRRHAPAILVACRLARGA